MVCFRVCRKNLDPERRGSCCSRSRQQYSAVRSCSSLVPASVKTTRIICCAKVRKKENPRAPNPYHGVVDHVAGPVGGAFTAQLCRGGMAGASRPHCVSDGAHGGRKTAIPDHARKGR